MLPMKYLVAVAFLAILASLGSALFFMLKGGKRDEATAKPKVGRMARALTFRIGFSVLLFICILVGWKLGYLHSTGIPAGK